MYAILKKYKDTYSTTDTEMIAMTLTADTRKSIVQGVS
jgi:hypothetical protein